MYGNRSRYAAWVEIVIRYGSENIFRPVSHLFMCDCGRAESDKFKDWGEKCETRKE